jgi:hypothetical protein
VLFVITLGVNAVARVIVRSAGIIRNV